MKFKLIILLGVASILSVAPNSNAQSIRCKGNLGKITVPSIHVPTNSICILRGTIVLRDITVGANARLIAFNADIKGNILAQDSLYLDLGSSTVKGFIKKPTLRRNLLPEILRTLSQS